MRVICTILIGMTLVCAIAGCGRPQVSEEVYMERQEKYQRLAIVCAPKEGANPDYARVILEEAQKRVQTRLGFLKTVDCLFNVTVDTTSTPPIPQIDNITDTNYDAVVCLIYSYEGADVYLEFRMLDTTSFEEIWYHRLHNKHTDIPRRLRRQGYWVPTEIKQDFYGL